MTPRPRRLPGGPVRAVLLDYGGTLVTLARPDRELAEAYGRIRSRLVELTGGPVPPAAELVAAVHDRIDAVVADHQAAGTLEEIDLEPVYLAGYAGAGVEVPRAALEELIRIEQRAWFAGVGVAAGVTRALRTLRARGIRLGLCSNAPYLAATMREQLEHVGLLVLLDSVTLSADAGWRKPSPRLFERALADLGAAPAETLMVGDRLHEDVEGAHGVGLRAALVGPRTAEEDPEGLADAHLDEVGDLAELLAAGPGGG